ncbi:unnamed protein product, partial [Urochloa humidicola]
MREILVAQKMREAKARRRARISSELWNGGSHNDLTSSCNNTTHTMPGVHNRIFALKTRRLQAVQEGVDRRCFCQVQPDQMNNWEAKSPSEVVSLVNMNREMQAIARPFFFPQC